MIAGSLEIQLMANMARLQRDMDDAKRSVGSAMASIEKTVGAAKSAIEALGIGLSVGMFAHFIKGAIDAADEMNDLSQRVGIAVKDLAKYELAASQSGTTMEALAKGIKGIAGNLAEHGAELKKAGINATDADGAMRQLADIFAKMPDGLEKTNLAVKLFGKSGMDLIPMLNGGSAALDDAAEKSAKYAATMAAMAPQADAFNDQLAELALAGKVVGYSMVNDAMPGLMNIAAAMNIAAQESGILKAAWIGLGGAMYEFIGKPMKVIWLGINADLDEANAKLMRFFGQNAEADRLMDAAAKRWKEIADLTANPTADTPDKPKLDADKWVAEYKKILDALGAGGDATKKANEEFKKQEELLAKLSGVNADYMEQLTRLQVIRNKHRITEEEYIVAVKELIALQPKAKKQMEEMEKAAKDSADAYAKYIDGLDKGIEKLKADIQAQEEHNARIGLSKEAIADLDAAKMESMATSLEVQAVMQMESDLTGVATNKLRQEAQMWRDLADAKRAGALKEATYDAAQKAAEDWKKASDQISQSLTDAIMRGGKSAGEYLEDYFRTLILRPVVQMIANPIAGAINGAFGSPGGGLSQGASYVNAGTSLYNGYMGMSSMGNTAAQLYQYGSTALTGGTAAVSTGAAGTGWVSAEGGASYLSTGASSIGSAFSTAVPYLAAAYAIYSIAKSLDHSGTYHTGALAEYSAATGLLTGSNGSHAGPRAGDTNYGTGFGGVDFSQQTADFVSGVSKSIVGILDSTASTFGKTAGYTAATAFADDTSKDGAWGALLIQKMGQSVVNWDDTRNSSWAPREFGDGEAGRTQYLAELSRSVRTALDDIGLPGWAQSMLDNLGNAPALTDLAAVVDKINATQKALVSMGDAIAGFTTLSDAAVTALVSASGGVDSFVAGMNAFYEGYYTDAEKIANVSGQVSDALSAVGLAMPQTREEFRALVEQELALGESGASAVAALLRVSGAFGTVADYSKRMADEAIANAQRQAEETAQAQQQAAETARQAAISTAQTALDTAMKGVDAAFSAVQRAVDAERKSITNAYNDQIKSINASITDVTGSVGKLTSLSNSLRSTIDRMRLSSDLGSDRSGAMAQIQSALAIAKAGGVFPDAESIASALNTISQPFDQLFGNATDYKRELMRQKDVLGQLADLTDSQKSIQERTLESLQDQLKVTEQGYSDEMTRLDGVLSAAQLQIDTLRGIDQSVMSVAAAIANLQINVGTAATAQANLSALTGTQPDSITGLYSNILGRQADATGAAFWQNALITNPKSWDGVVTDFINGALTGGTQSDKENALAWARANHIPGFAVGTSYVPYDMTARIHAGEEITPRPYVDIQRADRSRTNDLLSQLVEENRSMRAEIALLHSDNSAENRAIAQHANKTAKLMERAMPDGDAIATRVAV